MAISTSATARSRAAGDRAAERARRAEHPSPERARDFLQATLDSLPGHVAVLDEHGLILLANGGGEGQFPICPGAWLGIGDDFLAASDAAAEHAWAPRIAAGVRRILAGKRQAFALEYRCDTADGPRWFQLRAARHRAAGPRRVVLQHDDVTARCRAEEDAKMRACLLDEVDAAVIATDAEGLITHWSRGAERLYGWPAHETIGRPFAETGVLPDGEVSERAMKAAVRDRGRWEGRCDVGRKDGSTFPALVRLSALSEPGARGGGIVGVSVDVSDVARAERELRLAQSLSRAVTQSMGEGLCAVDEEGRLVYMNPTAEEMLGWTLAELTGRVIHHVIHSHRPDGSVSPQDECPILRSHTEGEVIRIEDDAFIRRDGTMLPVAYTASPFETAEGIRGSVYVFTDITERKARQAELRREMASLAWIPRITDALADDRMVLHAQPIIDLATGETVQHELLVRMLDTDGALVLPGLFLPVAEEHGLIADIDRWVIRQGMDLAGCGHAIELNVSARSLGEPNLADYVEQELRRSGADPQRICFELTETALLHNEEAARSFLARAAALGCQLALDDFGTGYGGFTYLKRFPVDYLKIDIEFVRDLPRDPASQHVVRAVVSLAQGFGQKTVAEGVEDEETLHLLADYGVDFAQGYHIGRPAPLGQTLGAR